MALAGIELSFLVKNLSELTKGYYVSNIYGINRESLLFKLHHPEWLWLKLPGRTFIRLAITLTFR